MEEIKYWLSILAPIGGFLIAQIISYVKMREKFNAMESDINGVGRKLTYFIDKSDLHDRDLIKRLGRIEGFLEGRYSKAGPVTQPTNE